MNSEEVFFIKKSKKKILSFLMPMIILLLSFLLLFLSPKFPNVVENVFANGFLKFFSYSIGGLISFLPFSFTEFFLFVLLPLSIVVFIVFLVKSKSKKTVLKKAGKTVLWLISIFSLLYVLLHGMNFARSPASEMLNFKKSETKYTPEFLQLVCIDLAKNASLARENITLDNDGHMTLSKSKAKTLNDAGLGYKKLEEKYPFLKGSIQKAKPVFLSRTWSYTGITGMYFPPFVEANVNVDQPDSSIPSTAAHELAHTRGFAKEDECNFFAFLSCKNSSNPDYVYSGYLLAYTHCINTLASYDEKLATQAREACSEGIYMDFAQSNAYWKQFEGPIQDVSTEINDSFIEAHGDKDGVLSYNRVVELILDYYFDYYLDSNIDVE